MNALKENKKICKFAFFVVLAAESLCSVSQLEGPWIHFDILHCFVLDVVFGSGIALYFMKYFDITLFGIIWYLVRVLHFMALHCLPCD